MLWSNECSSLQALGYTAVARACPKEVYKRQDVAAISGLLRTDQRTLRIRGYHLTDRRRLPLAYSSDSGVYIYINIVPMIKEVSYLTRSELFEHVS